VVECFELHAEGLGVNPLGWIPMLCASLNVLIELGIVINTNRFALGTICEMRGSGRGLPIRFSLGKKYRESQDYKTLEVIQRCKVILNFFEHIKSIQVSCNYNKETKYLENQGTLGKQGQIFLIF
jgi:hypothetical protein